MDVTILSMVSISILAGALNFILVGLALAMRLNIPSLCVNFDIPSTSYQDRIISSLVLGWAVFFWFIARAKKVEMRYLQASCLLA